jgi:hypothetical protein
VQDATIDDYCCSEVDTTDSCFHWKGQDKVGQGKKFYTHSMQMAKYSDTIIVVTGQARKAITPFQTWNCLITDKILDNIVQHRN